MRYWTYISGEVKGPFESGALREQPGFELTSLVCPENPDGSAASDWKEASGYPDIKAALSAPVLPPPPRKPAVESPLAMTMRGTLISDPVVDGKVVEAPVPVQAPPPRQQAAESPLAMTMRGTLISDPVVDGKVVEIPSLPLPPAPAPAPAAAEPVTFVQQLERMNASLSSLAAGQAQLLERLGRMEQAVSSMKAMLFPEQPK